MTAAEWRRLCAWCERHQNWLRYIGTILVVGLFVMFFVGFFKPDPKEAGKDIWAGPQWEQIFTILAVTGTLSIGPVSLYGLNNLIAHGRTKKGLTREAKREREAKRARELEQSQARVIELERELDITKVA